MLPALYRELTRTRSIVEGSNRLPYDEMIRSHWVRYLSIVAAGFLENSLKIILAEFAKRNSSPHVTNYVEAQLKQFNNPNADKIFALISSFNQKWATEIEIFWKDEKKDSIDSIMNIRHNIAHGRNYGITLGNITRYFGEAEKTITFVHDLILPNE